MQINNWKKVRKVGLVYNSIFGKVTKDIVFYVCVGLEMYNIFLNFNIPYRRTSALFILLKVVSGVKKKL